MMRGESNREDWTLRAAGAVHDFNHLLSVIAAHCQLLLDGPTDEHARQDIVAIQDATMRAANLARHVLLCAERSVPPRRVVDVNRQLAGVERMLRCTMGHDVNLVVKPSEVPALVLADPTQLELVALNLALNARDAMPHGGTLTVATSCVPPSCAYPGHVLLEVSDTGVGMDARTRERAFEPFFTTKKEGKGNGLGLATVRAIVADAGGSIAIETEVGKGTTLRVQFPSAEHTHHDCEHEQRSAEPARGRHEDRGRAVR